MVINEDQEIFETGEASPEDFPEAPRNRKVMGDLPSIKDKSFWHDSPHIVQSLAVIEQRRQELIAQIDGKHEVQLRGREFVCLSCPFEHTLPIDPDKYTLNTQGKIVPIDDKHDSHVT